MSIQRYSIAADDGPGVHQYSDHAGKWVLYDDYAKEISKRLQQIEGLKDDLTACQLELDRLKTELSEVARISHLYRNEAERLGSKLLSSSTPQTGDT